MIKHDDTSRKSNVVDLFSKKSAKTENNNVDYSLLDQLQSKRRSAKGAKNAQRDNLLILFPGFCA